MLEALSKEVKYLEVWLDEGLTFGTHVKNTAFRLEKQIYLK